ncbi:hypothetical protein EV2_033118 [Malus domestica]
MLEIPIQNTHKLSNNALCNEASLPTRLSDKALKDEASDDLCKDGQSLLVKNFLGIAGTEVPESELLQDVHLQRLGPTCQAFFWHNMSSCRHRGAESDLLQGRSKSTRQAFFLGQHVDSEVPKSDPYEKGRNLLLVKDFHVDMEVPKS